MLCYGGSGGDGGASGGGGGAGGGGGGGVVNTFLLRNAIVPERSPPCTSGSLAPRHGSGDVVADGKKEDEKREKREEEGERERRKNASACARVCVRARGCERKEQSADGFAAAAVGSRCCWCC